MTTDHMQTPSPREKPHAERASSLTKDMPQRDLRMAAIAVDMEAETKARVTQLERDVACLKGLSETQREAVVAKERVVRVIAGPGSGKTRVLIARANYLLSLGFPPSSIMLLTFTKKAANEMKSRLKTTIPDENLDQLWTGTFHSIAARILGSDIHKLKTNWSSNFTIIDFSASKSIVIEIVTVMLTEAKGCKPTGREISKKSDELTRLISMAKDKLETVHGLKGKDVQDLCFSGYLHEGHYANFADVFDRYMETLQEQNLLDFGDLLSCTVALLKLNADVLAFYRDRFQHILVDEMQDTNAAQYALLRLLVSETIGTKRPRASTSLFVVGDPNQSIYAFRGARVENLDRKMFDDFGKEMVTKTLTENYRSLSPIVTAAERLLKQHLSDSAYTEMTVMRREPSKWHKVRIMYNDDAETEADDIVDRIVELHGEGVPYEEMAVLYRKHVLSKTLEDALVRAKIPYCIKTTGFFERKEIKDVLCFLRFVINPMDAAAFDRIYNLPSRGIGKKSYNKLKKYFEQELLDFPRCLILDVMETHTNEHILKDVIIPAWMPPRGLKLHGKAVSGINELRRIFVMLRSVARSESVVEVIDCLLNDCRYKEVIQTSNKNDPTTGSPSSVNDNDQPLMTRRLANIDMLKDAVPLVQQEDSRIGLEALTSYLQHLLLCQEAVEKDRGVQLLTLHAAKGSEFKIVFIIGCEDGCLPLGNNDLYEEARLMFVGITRAVDQLTLCVASSRPTDYWEYREPSCFVSCVES